ncbi:MAG: NTP transferase domain-containing protein [Deltaproteobacteria bacterium]|nr:NTP transferase domain-containing protein [Deltaproteobacteria bacterium]MBW2136541.1 NTP transferase domain-containing protein [Deltaproteobacteria bacterium]
MHMVVMAGGSGTRFWPASRKDRPKQFLNISGKEPMLVETCNRLHPLARDEEIIIVLGENHLKQAQDLLEGRKVHFLAEPIGRNTAPCIGFGAIYASHLGCKGPVAFLPADHYIGKPGAFTGNLRDALDIADSGAIVTLGIVPTRPDTGYGYIRKSKHQDNRAYRVEAFVEKPDLHRAEQYLVSGEYLWNAGIFVATPETIMREIKRHLPKVFEGLERIRRALDTPRFQEEVLNVYEGLESISFDYGIMEKTREPVYVVPSDCGWSDVGSWESLFVLRSEEHDKDSNLAEGETILVDCAENFVSSRNGRMVACLGLKRCLVVDTQDALLVADLGRSQDVREIIRRLEINGIKHLL